MTKFVLYHMPPTCARVPLIALEETGVPFETKVVRVMTGEHRSPEYLALNPKGKVPILVIDDEVLSENVAILLYLADRFPDAKLLPAGGDGLNHFKVVSDLCFFATTIHPIITRICLPSFFADGDEAHKSVQSKAIEAMHMNIQLVENRLKNGSWWYGDQWSALDAYAYWSWSRLTGSGFPVESYPACQNHARQMDARPAVQRALAREGEAVEQLRAEGLNIPPRSPTR